MRSIIQTKCDFGCSACRPMKDLTSSLENIESRMSGLTVHALQTMGYKRLGLSERLSAKFTRLDVFSIQGITLGVPSVPPVTGVIDDISFKVGIGSSVNEICMDLVDEEFVEDELLWREDARSMPPFLVLCLGPTEEFVASGGFFKEDCGDIETYDSFSAVKLELQIKFDKVVPSLLTSLSRSFENEGIYPCVIHKAKSINGRTPDGRKVNDWNLEIRGAVCSVMEINKERSSEILKHSVEKIGSLDEDFAKNFYEASCESDPLKRFLSFFWALERIIHISFEKIDHKAAVSRLLLEFPKMSKSGRELLGEHRKSWSNIRQKFIWCSLQKWVHLTDEDVEKFVELKEVRDKISHGRLSAPDAASIKNIEDFVLRVIAN